MAEKPTPEQDTQRYNELRQELEEVIKQSDGLLKQAEQIMAECQLIRLRSFGGKTPPRPGEQPPTPPNDAKPEGTGSDRAENAAG